MGAEVSGLIPRWDDDSQRQMPGGGEGGEEAPQDAADVPEVLRGARVMLSLDGSKRMTLKWMEPGIPGVAPYGEIDFFQYPRAKLFGQDEEASEERWRVKMLKRMTGAVSDAHRSLDERLLRQDAAIANLSKAVEELLRYQHHQAANSALAPAAIESPPQA